MSRSIGDSKCERVGRYSGIVADRFRESDLLAQLSGLDEILAGPDVSVLSDGRNRIVRTDFKCDGRSLDLVVKSFGRQAAWKDLAARKRGSKARRTWVAARHLAQHGIGTPEPVACLEHWQGSRLTASHYISEFVDGAESFHSELIRLFRTDPQCAKFMAIMQVVADAVAAMHEAGFQHNDLGNQNILVKRQGEQDWSDVCFLDLNRARIRPALSARDRGRDISRLNLPSDLLRVFLEMYSGDVPAPEFLKWERVHRQRYSIHAGTRHLRHPIRYRGRDRSADPATTFPAPRDMWIWDDRSAQAIGAMNRKERARHYAFSRHISTVGATVSALPAVWKLYKHKLSSCYRNEVTMTGRIGVAFEPCRDMGEQRLALLDGLGPLPVLVRFYHHETEDDLAYRAETVRALHDRGHSVSVALVQDREAVNNPDSWRSFVSAVLGKVAGCVTRAEVGHAINRTKWGIWEMPEYSQLLKIVNEEAGRLDVKLMGPAAIDFEYQYVMSALRYIPRETKLDALSHHLYVDRRGAPENRQGRFSALEKFALARAIAAWSPVCEDRLIISEVNWPITGTGVYSPVGSPYESPGPRHNDPSVTEDEYADYMIRYLLMAVCSGMVEQVYWWRLVAHGFGLVDDIGEGALRERPAYRMLRQFLSVLSGATFLPALSRVAVDGDEPIRAFAFSLPDGSTVTLIYSHPGDSAFEPDRAPTRITDAFGDDIPKPGARIDITGRPVYIYSDAAQDLD